MSKINKFSEKIINWRASYGRRGLPWQGQTDPYRVWLSEIMLQQTQVSTVVDRYQRFLQRFPTVLDLATAQEEAVMSEWAGMGYYTRARNLWACAKLVVEKHGGSFPRSARELETLPGIGRSTSAAIAAFCYQERTPILDGNVKRVLARWQGIELPINQSATDKILWDLAEKTLPKSKELMPSYTQGIMDFGATVCTPKRAVCQTQENSSQRGCVLARECVAYQAGKVAEIPFKIPKKTSPLMTSDMLLIFAEGSVLLEKRPSKGIWGGLWTFPETIWRLQTDVSESAPNDLTHFGALASYAQDTHWQKAMEVARPLGVVKHIFTHRTLFFKPRVLRFKTKMQVSEKNLRWFDFDDLKDIGMPKPVEDILASFSSN